MSSESGSEDALNSNVLDLLTQEKLKQLEAGGEPLDCGMINPDLPPPRFLLDKLAEACIKPANHRYAVSRGVRKLREGFAEKYRSTFGVVLDPDAEICVTMGTKDALQHIFTTTVPAGSKVLLPSPAYPSHVALAKVSGHEVCYFKLAQGEGETLRNLGQSLEAESPDLILLNFPHNPTGIEVSPAFYDELAILLRASGKAPWVVNDFVYGELSYSKRGATSALGCSALRPKVLETMSLSKSFSVPGWRVGAVVGERSAVAAIARRKSVTDYGIFLPIQLASAAALTSTADLAATQRMVYARRARILTDGLSLLGWRVANPTAGAAVWAEIPSEVQDALMEASPDLVEGRSTRIAIELLRRSGILAMPGILFGAGWEGFMRFALVLPEEQIRTLLERLNAIGRRRPITPRLAGTGVPL